MKPADLLTLRIELTGKGTKKWGKSRQALLTEIHADSN